jgi:hypothetical protein
MRRNARAEFLMRLSRNTLGWSNSRSAGGLAQSFPTSRLERLGGDWISRLASPDIF